MLKGKGDISILGKSTLYFPCSRDYDTSGIWKLYDADVNNDEELVEYNKE